MTQFSHDRETCPIHRATDVISDQWTVLILREFFLEGPRRFGDLQSVLGISPNTLSTRLKRLEDAGVLARELYSQRPLRASYALTARGEALAPVFSALYDWGRSLQRDDAKKPRNAG